ncbi:MAG: hypothetical protein AAB400_00135 [Patescibacteria group bacterium]
MAAIVLRTVLEILKHVFYHLLGSWFEKAIEAVLRKRRRKRKKSRTKELVAAPTTECYTIRLCDDSPAASPVAGMWIILGKSTEVARVVILIDDDTCDR